MPLAARSNSISFSCAAWGAWSVAMQSTVPSSRGLEDGQAIAFRPKRRVHLEVRIVAAESFVGQSEVVRRRLAGNVQTLLTWQDGLQLQRFRRWRHAAHEDEDANLRQPRCRAGVWMSRSTMLDSASTVIPRRPRRKATGPKFILQAVAADPAPVMRVSSAC